MHVKCMFASSMQRAKSIKTYLSAIGIMDGKIIVQAFGESKLIEQCPVKISCDESVHSKNRRAEILLVSPMNKDLLSDL